MKKLMCAVAALAAGVAMADTGIQSANVVGYQNKELILGGNNNFIVRTLQQVGTDWDDMTLGMLTVTLQDDLGEGGWDPWADYVYTLDPANGLPTATYTYMTPYYAQDYSGLEAGWYTKDEIDDLDNNIPTSTRNSTKLNFREGFKVVIASGNEVTVNNAGEVIGQGWIPVAMAGGGENNFTGNVTPSPITLGDITVTDQDDLGEGGWDPWADYLYTLDPANGLPTATYAYMTKYYSTDYTCTPGWYTKEAIDDADNTPLTDAMLQNDKVNFAAGAGFKVVIASGNEVNIYIPSALGTGE